MPLPPGAHGVGGDNCQGFRLAPGYDAIASAGRPNGSPARQYAEELSGLRIDLPPAGGGSRAQLRSTRTTRDHGSGPVQWEDRRSALLFSSRQARWMRPCNRVRPVGWTAAGGCRFSPL